MEPPAPTTALASPTAAPAATPPSPPSPAWMRRVPLITGALAALAGYLTVRGADLSNNAIYRSNQAVLMQTQASDKWAEYQADSGKAANAENLLLTLDPTSAARSQLEARAADFRGRQAKLRVDAIGFEHQRDQLNYDGLHLLKEKDWSDYAGVAAQLGIALASIAALTRRPEWFTIAVVVGIAAVAMTGVALLSHFHPLAMYHHLLHGPARGPATAAG